MTKCPLCDATFPADDRLHLARHLAHAHLKVPREAMIEVRFSRHRALYKEYVCACGTWYSYEDSCVQHLLWFDDPARHVLDAVLDKMARTGDA